MGVTLACKKTGSSCDLSYTGFQKFRNKIAHLCCEEFGQVDDKIERYARYRFSSEIEADEAKKEIDKEIEKLIQNKKISIKIVDFVLQSDCEGSIRYGACKQIYKHIKDYDDNICYGYAARDCARFKDLKALIKECYDNKSDLVWN